MSTPLRSYRASELTRILRRRAPESGTSRGRLVTVVVLVSLVESAWLV